jgi:hypothetical protein
MDAYRFNKMSNIKEDVYAAEFSIRKWVDKVTGKTRTRRIRPNRITFANNLLQGVKPTVDLGDPGSPYLYKMPVVKKSPTAKAVISKQRAAVRKAQRQEKKRMDETLDPSMGAGEYVKDFKKSTAPQFKGKSSKKRAEMAIAAYMGDKTKSQNEGLEMTDLKQLAEYAAELSLVEDLAFFLCVDDDENIYISEEYNEDTIAAYVDGEMVLEDGLQLDKSAIINELNYDTLKSYSSKAKVDLNKKLGDVARTRKVSVKTADKITNRIRGLEKAEDRMEKKVNEEAESRAYFILESLQSLAEQAIQESIESGQAVFVCVDEQEELYLSEEFSDDVIATYIDGEVYISDEDAEYIEENVALALAGQLFE